MKPKSLILFTFLVIFANQSFSQGWETLFPADTVIGAFGHTIGLEVEQALDGGYLMAGDISYPTGAPRDFIRLAKADAEGEILWQQVYDAGGINHESVAYLKELTNGKIILAGNHFPAPHIKIVDTNGEIITEKTHSNDTIYNIIHGVDYFNDGFILMGTFTLDFTGEYELFLSKFDNDGNLLWQGAHPLTNIGLPSSVAIASDGGFVILGNLNSKISLTKLNVQGDFIWNHIYQTSDNDISYVIKRAFDNGFILGGASHGINNNHFPVLLKTDSLGAAEWVKIFSDNLSGGITDIELTPDDGFIATGSVKNLFTFTNDGFIIKSNSLGQLEWSENFNDENKQFAAVKNTIDGGFILAGQSNGEMFLKKIGGTTSIKNTFSNSNVEVYPNPMNQQTIFKLNDSNFKTKHLQIYDSKGSLVFEKIFSDNSFIFYRNKFNSGIYFYQVKNEGNIISTGKLIIN